MNSAVIALCVAGSVVAAISRETIGEKLTAQCIVPDVIDAPWSETLCVNYPKTKVRADYGNELTPTEVRDKPELSWDADKDSFYTVAIVDPDAPSRKDPKFREWLHWLVVNVPGSSIKDGTPLAEYVGSAPPKGSGLHRYVQLVYKQPKKLTFSEKPITGTEAAGRTNFSIRKFAKKYDLGPPIAGNFYTAQWDKTADEILASLGQ